MSKYKNVADFFAQRGPEDIERFIDKNLDISQQVYALLKEKGWRQHDLATRLGKSDAELSKWLSGSHNLTLHSIAKMEAVLGADIILTPQKAEARYRQVEYVYLRIQANANERIPSHVSYSAAETAAGEADYEAILKVA